MSGPLYFRPSLVTAFLTLSLALGCGGEGSRPAPGTAASRAPGGLSGALSAAAEAPGPSTEPVESELPTVVFLGDSLTAGYGLDQDQAYPALIETRLAQLGHKARVVNAGVSGDTSAGGLSRLPWLLKQKPAVLFVELGANDGLRGGSLAETEKNLREIIRQSQAAGAKVVLAGMMLPPNYGHAYTQGFAEIFPRLAREYKTGLVPFLLEGVAAEPDLNQADGIHPNATGQEKVADNVLPKVVEALGGER
ncbi:MAG: arylesterase [Thermoanaerobaculia bacterium]